MQPQELRDKWLTALRSDDWVRGNAFLRYENHNEEWAYDAFGVLCELHGVKWVMSKQFIHCYGVEEVRKVGSKETVTLCLFRLPDEIKRAVNLRDVHGASKSGTLRPIAQLSDDPTLSFAQIADLISENIEEYFYV